MKPETKLKRLMSKKRLTGKDLGEIVLLQLAMKLQRGRDQSKPEPPTIPQEELQEILDTLSSTQTVEYNIRANLHNAVVGIVKNESAYASQFFHAYYKLQDYLTDIADYEKEYVTAGSRPLIITKPAYTELIKKAATANAQMQLSYYDLLFYTLDYFVMCEQQPLLLPPSIREELDNLKGITIAPAPAAEPPKPAIEPQDKEAIRQYVLETYNTAKLFYVGKRALIDYWKAAAPNYNTAPLEDMTENELIDYIGELGGASFLASISDTLNAAPAVQSQTKHDLLLNCLNTYKATKGQTGQTQAARTLLKHFKTEYPRLYKAINAYMCTGIPELAGLKANQQLKPIIKASYLAGVTANYEPIKVMLIAKEPDAKDIMSLFDDTDPEQFLLKAQIGNGGISLIEYTTPRAYPKGFTNGIYTADLKQLDPECFEVYEPSYNRFYEDVIFQTQWAKDAAIKIFAQNAYLKAAFMGLGIDYLDIAYINTQIITECIKSYNDALYTCYAEIPGTPEQRAEHRRIMKNAFKPIEVDELKPTAEIEERLTDTINTLKEQGQLIAFYTDPQGVIAEIISLIKGAANE